MNTSSDFFFSTGLNSLDNILQGILPGDNVVWQVNSMEDYYSIVSHFTAFSCASDKTLIYFRFAGHKKLISDDIKAVTFNLNPQDGFEFFISEILRVIELYGKGACYVFDCLSGLSVDWYSDRMLGNFFMLTCPYLYKYETATYFVLLKNVSTPLALTAIHNTAQVVLDVIRSNEKLYILPLKVFNRSSKTMYMLHSWDENNFFSPVTKSPILSDILSKVPQTWLYDNIGPQDTWINTFKNAEELQNKIENGTIESLSPEIISLKIQLIKMVLTRDDKLIPLCEKYFEINNLISIGKRMIGTGLIGGKSAGMLLARRILRNSDEKWEALLETHDSFFIGSDVFYTYIIMNDCWWERRALSIKDGPVNNTDKIRHKLLNGTFPQDIIEQFKEILHYFGQSPIIVRSSSLLEDAYGNAFSGKYESVFCANQGSPEERLKKFIEAVREVYASTMSIDALTYRASRELLERDEQMALLVQRVSGSFYDNIYFPQIAGVGYSYNPFVWNSRIDPKEGVLRLVFGLGTRAVDRHDNDYTRVVAINAPLMRPESSIKDVKKYTQRVVDILDLSKNKHTSVDFENAAKIANDLPLYIFASHDYEMEAKANEMNIKNFFPYILTFENLFTQTNFLENMKTMLKTLSSAYQHPVDIEFSANFLNDTEYRINLLQCRSFQFIEGFIDIKPPENIKNENIILKTKGPIIGQSIYKNIDIIINILPSKYGTMSTSDRYSVARIIGELTNQFKKDKNIMLIGPGRWGTKMPELGVPVSFSEIKNVRVLCEIVKMHEGLTPDISLGTHFFNDLVEMKILYMGIFPGKEGYIFNEDKLLNFKNELPLLLPDVKPFFDAIQVIYPLSSGNNKTLSIHVNTLKQEGILYF